MRCTKDAAKGYSLNCQSGAGQFFHHTERDARTRPSRMADERRGVLSTARVRKTRANTFSRAVRPTSYPQVCISWGEGTRGSAGLVLFLPMFCLGQERRSPKTISSEEAYLRRSTRTSRPISLAKEVPPRRERGLILLPHVLSYPGTPRQAWNEVKLIVTPGAGTSSRVSRLAEPMSQA